MTDPSASPPHAARLEIRVDGDDRVNWAMQQNDVPVVERLALRNVGDDTLDDLLVRVTLGDLAPPWEARILSLAADATWNLEAVDLRPDPARLARQHERESIVLTVEVSRGDETLARVERPVAVLAANEWGGLQSLPEMASAFVLPNHPEVQRLLREAAERLRAATGDGSLSGYQRKDARRVHAVLAALWDALVARGVAYVNPPASFEATGQKVRLPDQVLTHRLGTCFDLSVLLAAACEQAGLSPLLLFVEGHAFVGVWTHDETFPEPFVDDLLRVRKRVELDEIAIFETTLATTSPAVDAETARRRAAAHLQDDDAFLGAVDVRAARLRGVRPLPFHAEPSVARGDDETARDVVAGDAGAAAAPGDARASAIDAAEATGAASAAVPADGPADEPEEVAAADAAPSRPESSSDRLARWKRRLLDLSLRNRLLAFRETKKTVPLLCPEPAQFEDALQSGRRFTILPRPERAPDDPRDPALAEARSHDDPVRRFLHEELAAQRLHADLPQAELDRRLLELFRAARSSLEETGANTLFLALGFLHWTEPDGDGQVRRAPILLLPLELERRSLREGFRIALADEDARVNATLLEKLRTEFALELPLDELPEDEAGVDVGEVLQRFRRAVRDMDGWEVKVEAAVGLFSFTKFMMWRDLEDRRDSLLAHPVVEHLVARPDGAFEARGGFPDPGLLDATYDPTEVFCPLDADSSQLAAVLAAEAGSSYRLEGPPGTGKSQTITNMVAQLLARGRRVLFVAEKRAALDVVRARLERIGLGPFCLELHSNGSSKRAVLQQLGEALAVERRAPPAGWADAARRLAELRAELNAYVETLHAPTPLGKSVHEVASELVELDDVARVKVGSLDPRDVDADAYARLLELLDRVATAVAAVGVPARHPLAGIGNETWETSLPERLRQTSEAALATAEELRAALDAACALLAPGAPASEVRASDVLSRRALAAVVKACALLADAPAVGPALLGEPSFAASSGVLGPWIDRGEAADARLAQLARRWDARLLELDHDALLQRWRAARAAFWPLSTLRQRAVRGELAGLWRAGGRVGAENLDADLEQARALAAERRALRDPGIDPAALFGPAWRADGADWHAMRAALAWSGELRDALAQFAGDDVERLAALRARCAELVTRQRDLLAADAAHGRALRAVGAAHARHVERVGAVLQLARADEGLVFGAPDVPGLLPRVVDVLARWRDRRAELRDWCHWRRLRTEAATAGVRTLVTALEEGEVPGGALVRTFRRSFLEDWLNASIDGDERLRGFVGAEHERRIGRFAELDARALELAREHLVATLAARVPTVGDETSPNSELGLLERELRKKRRHLPVRRLFERLPNVLPRLKPCVLMSPLSVAQYLDAQSADFDLVVFDEASQIPVWDAIGAVARARQVVVVGDSKQLPPTNFFHKVEDEDEPAEDDFEELESLLDECAAAHLPSLDLRWHYRSRHESLIAFSNAHYYDNRLVTFPSPADRGERLGVVLRRVEGTYDKGGRRSNQAEGEAVVAEIAARAREAARGGRRPSLGVVTFSLAQQQLVEGLLEAGRRDDPALDAWLDEAADEPLFVKNLENVQGDERDVILLSVAYGPDARGRVSMNFGPLNREGGERRLNVAITRAREQVVVFTSLRGEQIDLARTRAAGVRHLKRFLEYAERGPSAIAEHTAAERPVRATALERRVERALAARGLAWEAAVGCSGSRIDVAVRDPERPERFVLGVLGDGSGYARARTARDRDRLRGQVLGRLGWTLHRVWSTDAWLQPEREDARLLAALDAALAAARADETVDTAPAAEAVAETEAVAGPADAAGSAAGSEPGDGAEAVEPRVASGEVAPDGLVERPYEACVLRRAGDADGLVAKAADARVAQQVAQVVEAEGPLALDLLVRRVAEAWEIERVGEKVRQRVLDALAALPDDARPVVRDETAWPAGVDPRGWRLVRVPVEGDDASLRALEHVPVEELANAAELVLRRNVSLPHDDLLRETARRLGVARAGARQMETLASGVGLLLREGRAVREGDVIRQP